jgi:hypothetical protein
MIAPGRNTMAKWNRDGHATAEAIEVAPETMVPVQFFDTRRSGAAQVPEKRLMLAVLEAAVAEFQRHARAGTRAGQRAFDDAEAWIGSDDVQWPFSFVNICQALALEPGAVRSALWRWRDAERARVGGPPVVFRTPFRRVTGSRTTAAPWRRCA